MASFACGTRDEPYMPPPGQTPCCWNTACHGGTRNIYKLKATSCGLFCIRKPCPTLNTSSERMRVCRPGRPRHRVMENVTPNACHGCAHECQEKSLEDFEAFTFVLFCTKDRERRGYSPSTAFLAAAAIWSRSSLVGCSFAATQLSSSILNRALSGSCSSMAS